MNYSKLSPFNYTNIADSIATKLVSRPTVSGGPNIRSLDLSKNGLMQRVTELTTANANDAAALEEILPEQSWLRRIVISTMLSPKDLMTVELTHGIKKNVKGFKSQLANPLLAVMRDFWDNDYKITSKLGPWAEDALFKYGAHARLVIPETSIDAMINGLTSITKESLSLADVVVTGNDFKLGNKGILGNGTKYGTDGKEDITGMVTLEQMLSVEGYKVDREVFNHKLADDITIIDNPDVVKLALLRQNMSRRMALKAVTNNSLSISKEARKENKKGYSDAQIAKLYDRPVTYKHVVMVPTQESTERPTVGHCFETHLPADSIMRVFPPGDVTNPLGYFIAVDMFGYPATYIGKEDSYRSLESSSAMNRQQTNSMIMSNFGDMSGRQLSVKDADRMESGQIYEQLLEATLKDRLKTGIYNDGVVLAKAPDFYKMMLARHLSKQRTQMLFVPAELVTYIAFEYNDYGIGQSLTDKNKILGSIRAMLLFANTSSGIKNAVGRTRLRITLDEADPAPEETVQTLVDNYMRNRGARTPYGTLNPVDITQYVSIAGVEVEVEGNAKYPQTKFAVEDFNSQKSMVDTTLEEDMRRRYIMGHDVPPELVDMSFNPEFATTFLSNNQLFAKSQMERQLILTQHVTDFIVKYTRNSQILMDELRAEIVNNKSLYKKHLIELAKDPKYRYLNEAEASKLTDEDIVTRAVDMFLDAYEVSLPAPDLGTMAAQKQMLEDYSEFIDDGLQWFMSSEAFDSSTFGEGFASIDSAKANYKMILMRDFMRKNNILPELDRIVTKDDNGKPNLDLLAEQQDHIEAVMESIKSFLKDAKKKDEEMTKALNAFAGADGNVGDTSDGLTDDTQLSDSPDGEDTDNPDADSNPDSTDSSETETDDLDDLNLDLDSGDGADTDDDKSDTDPDTDDETKEKDQK